MTNADKFKNIFGLYATELWSMPEKDFLKWLNSEAMNCSEFPNNSDTISRQDAVSRRRLLSDLKELITAWEKYPVMAEQIKGVEVAIGYVELIPSAQPERTCVNCGRTVNNGGWYADGGTRCPIEEHYALPKDGFCHLWEKRNVTDDDYPERQKYEHV